MSKFDKVNYKNNIVNFTSSLMKYYGQTSKYPTHALVDFILSKKYKHVAVVLLDGLGMKIIDDNMNNGSILKTHQIIKMNSVFPPTTVAATTAYQTGKAPIESGWLGWHLYLDDTHPSTVLFMNKAFYSEEPIEDFKVQDVIPNTPFYTKLRRAKSYEIYPSFKENGVETFKDGIDRLIEITSKDEANFTYFYWDQPDGLMHQFGTTSQVVKVTLMDIEAEIERLKENLPDDTCIFITADHGQVDVKPIYMSEYPDIVDTFEKPMSGEGRFTQFYINPSLKDDFVAKFNEHFKDDFDLYTKEEFIESKISGLFEPHPSIEYSLGNFIAIAKTNYFFEHSSKHEPFKGHHAGCTAAEMEIPLILLKRKDEHPEEEVTEEKKVATK